MHFNKKLFAGLTATFILMTVIGTVCHEFGHYIVAKSFGYNAKISYNTSWWIDATNSVFMDSTFNRYKDQINSNKVFPESTTYYKIAKRNNDNHFWIILGGTLQTIFTGTVGMVLIIISRKAFKGLSLGFKQWLFIFLALFWMRQTANFVVYIGCNFINGYFPKSGDEIKLAQYLNLPEWIILAITAIIGVIVLLVIIFKFVPFKQRLTFIVSGLVGGISGFVLRLQLFGKLILP